MLTRFRHWIRFNPEISGAVGAGLFACLLGIGAVALLTILAG